ncbi:10269_t:CDS:2, partial [Cetraspora pellucida]
QDSSQDSLYSEICDSIQKELKIDPLSVESLFDNLSNKKRKKPHPLRQYLEPSDSGLFVCCKQCSVQWQKSSGISTIKAHFKKFHTDIYNQLELDIKKTKPIQPYGIDNELKVKRITYLLIKWIICNQQSFIVVEDPSFVELIEELDERYRLPSRQTVSIQIENIYQKQQLLDMMDILVASNNSLKTNYPTELEWSEIDEIYHLLNPIYQATLMLSSSSHPTLGDLYLIFTTINRSLEEIINNTIKETTPKLVATAMLIKLDEYWQKLDQSSFMIAPLDPNIKLSLYDSEKQHKAQQYIENLYSKYITSNASSSSQTDTLKLTSRDYFKKALRRPFNSPGVTSELRNYLMSSEVDCEVLSWWKAHANNQNYKNVAKMAQDYLCIQATSVPSEQVFSVAKHTINPLRNRLDPEKARATLCLKSWYESG